MITTNYKIHPYCFLFAHPECRVDMTQIDCSQKARYVEVCDEDGFIYSEYYVTGHEGKFKVGYRLSSTPETAGVTTICAEVLVEDSNGCSYGSIVGGAIRTTTEFTPAFYIQCGDRARGGDPRVLDVHKSGMIYTVSANQQLCLNPKMNQELCMNVSSGHSEWKVSKPLRPNSRVVTTLSGEQALCNDPTKPMGKLICWFDYETKTICLKGVELKTELERPPHKLVH